MLYSGCSGNGFPTQPQYSPASSEIQQTMQYTREDNFNPAHHLWSYFHIFIDPADPDNFGMEIIPVRLTATHWNVLQYLEKGPCTNCVTIKGIMPSGSGTLLVDLEIRHPFIAPNLTGFDVRGIAMFPGSYLFSESGLLTSDLSDDGGLINAEGYTTLYNPSTVGSGPGGLQGYIKGKFASAVFPDSTLNGYIRHNSPGALNTRNAFYAGQTILKTYEIKMPTGPFVFGYAVDASWAPPTNTPVTNPILDFPPEANCPEAWKVSVDHAPIGQGLTDLGGSALILIDVYDWQGKSTVIPPKIECTELFDGFKTASWLEDGAGFSRFTVEVENEKLAPSGSYMSLIVVEDTENDSAPGWLDLTACQIFELTVVPFDNATPIAIASLSPASQTVCEPINFTDNGSYDPDGGSIVKFEWDWDNDGNFDEEGDDVFHSWDAVGTFQVQFRVTDDEGSQSTLVTPLTVEIVNALPTAVAQADKYAVQPGDMIAFSGTDSHDNDCLGYEIVDCEWDWEFDGVYDETGMTAYHAYADEGTYYVQLRVTDDEGGTAVLEVPLKIQVSYDYFDPIPMATASATIELVCEPILFEDDGSYDPDGGLIIAWEWDWDNDGIYDEMGKAVIHSWDTPGIYHVGFRVFDDEGKSAALDPPLEIAIEHKNPTAVISTNKVVAFVGESIHLDGSGSYDNDCDGHEIVSWGWDYNNDLVIDEYGAVVDTSFFGKGDREVQLTVTDNEGGIANASVVVDVNNGWARTWGGSNTDIGKSVAIDNNGNIWVLGNFYLDCDFNPGEGVDEFESVDGTSDIFLSKFNSSGDYLGVWRFGGSGSDFPIAVVIGEPGYIYVAGIFQYTIDLDPGYFQAIATSKGSYDFFIVKLSDIGDYQWCITVGGTGEDRIRDIRYSSSDNCLYYTGTFANTVNFHPFGGTDNKTSNGSFDVFLSKIGTNGPYQWTKTWGGSQADWGVGLAVENNGNVYVGGIFQGIVDFDAGPGIFNATSAGSFDVFILKYLANGDFSWVNTWGGSDMDWCNSVTGCSNFGELWVAGGFTGTVDFDPTANVDNRTSNGGTDAYLSGFNPDGSRISTATWGGPGYDEAISTYYISYTDNVYVTGVFSDTVDFDPGSVLQIKQAMEIMTSSSQPFIITAFMSGLRHGVEPKEISQIPSSHAMHRTALSALPGALIILSISTPRKESTIILPTVLPTLI